MNIGAVTIGLAVVAILAWVAILLNSGRAKSRRAEEPAPNLQPYLTDDELENKRTDRVLIWALVGAVVLAIALPIYFLNEPTRQAEAAEELAERDVEFGEEWYTGEFVCVDCHGVDGVGGGAAFIEPRSGLEVTWAAPSLNDVFYRYDEDEVRFWITYGRQGTPMPPAGLDGGGSMTSQQVDQTLAYLQSIQIPQNEAFAKTDPAVTQALGRLDTADEAVAASIVAQHEAIEEIEAAPGVASALAPIQEEIVRWIIGADTCTDASAAIVGAACPREGTDSDRDGITDAAEVRVEGLFAEAAALLDDEAMATALDPATAFSNTNAAGEPIQDLVALTTELSALESAVITISVVAENQESFLNTAEHGLSFLEVSEQQKRWEIDIAAIAAEAFDGDIEEATRAAGLYNALCARCHTAGYSAGVPYTEAAGSGAWAPALTDGRSVTQFPDPEDQVDFVISGSELGKNYGVFGVGRGWMPGFGFTVSQADIERIVKFERAL